MFIIVKEENKEEVSSLQDLFTLVQLPSTWIEITLRKVQTSNPYFKRKLKYIQKIVKLLHIKIDKWIKKYFVKRSGSRNPLRLVTETFFYSTLGINRVEWRNFLRDSSPPHSSLDSPRIVWGPQLLNVSLHKVFSLYESISWVTRHLTGRTNKSSYVKLRDYTFLRGSSPFLGGFS